MLQVTKHLHVSEMCVLNLGNNFHKHPLIVLDRI
jgi:hypothetical protein